MKPVFRLFAVFVAAAILCGCPGPEPDTPTGEKKLISVTPTSISCEAVDNSTYSIVVSSEGAWTASTSDTWIHISPTSGNGTAAISLSVDTNTGDGRNGTVTVKDPSGSVTVSVSQAKTSLVTLSASPDAFDGVKRAGTTYQLLIYTFADSDGDGIGDFNGIVSKLDYLDSMGATAIWLSPAHPTSSYHAYDVDDYYTLNPLYGSGKTSESAEADFKNLVEKAHAKGIGIYMDYVLNHSGSNNEWFKQAVLDENSPYRSYYIFSANPASDVAEGKIPMLASEGSKAYSSGEWYAVGGSGRFRFQLDWKSDSAPQITVTKTDDAPFTGTSGKYLYFGDGEIKEFKAMGGNKYELVVDFSSSWGFLIRTSKTSWAEGTKYGTPAKPGPLTFGVPYTLAASSSSFDPGNISLGVFYHSNFAQSMPDLNYGELAAAESSPAFVDVAKAADKWIRDFGIDGFRLDAVKHIYHNQTSSENPTFLAKWYERCNATYKEIHGGENMFIVGEVLDSHSVERIYYSGLPSLFGFGFRDNVLTSLKNGSGSSFAKNVRGFIDDHKVRRSDAVTSLIIGNHDINRVASELGKNVAKEKQAAAMLLTAEGKPFIYQGDELGYWGDKSSHGDEDIRMPIRWDKAGKDMASKGLPNGTSSYSSMLSSSLSVEAQEADANSILNVYKTFSRLRNTYPALAVGEMSTTSVSESSAASWYMTSGNQKLLVIHNVSSAKKSFNVTDDMSHPVALLGAGTVDGTTLTLEGNSSVVFLLK